MPKYAKIQAAIARKPQPRTSKVWTFINSSLFLWFLSAILITALGAMISARQECIKSGKAEIDRYDKIAEEIRTRRFYLWQGIREASTITEGLNLLKEKKFKFVEFKETTTSELLYAITRFDFTKRVVRSDLMSLIPPVPTERAERFMPILFGDLPRPLKADDLPDLKNFMNRVVEDGFSLSGKTVRADCSIGGLISLLATGKLSVEDISKPISIFSKKDP